MSKSNVESLQLATKQMQKFIEALKKIDSANRVKESGWLFDIDEYKIYESYTPEPYS